jgi:uncharacterized membrane protein
VVGSPEAVVRLRGESTTRAEPLTADATTQSSFRLRFEFPLCISLSIAVLLLVVTVLIDHATYVLSGCMCVRFGSITATPSR